MAIRVLLVGHQAMEREGLQAVLVGRSGYQVVGQAEDPDQAIMLAAKQRCDVALWALGLAEDDGVDSIRRLRAARPTIRILVLSPSADKQQALNLLAAGATGYLVKTATSGELLEAIRAVTRTRKYFGAAAAEVWPGSQNGWRPRPQATVADILSPRQREILQLVAEGRSSKGIANELKISQNTVEVHRRNLTRKLGLKNIAEVTRYAIREGLVSL